jgi:CelD/BcsL family acetyltransferase involved in cellulose biosynthesis
MSWHWIGTLLAAIPPTNRPELLRGRANDQTVSLALLGSNELRRRGLVRSRGLYLNETGNPHFDSLTIEHNGILAAAEWDVGIWDALIAWFASLQDTDELYVDGSLWRLPETTLGRWRLQSHQTSLPSYSIDLFRLQESEGELYPVLSANARQQLRRALRHFEEFGVVRLTEAKSITEALSFFTSMKTLHCASWERRGRQHSFAGEFFEPFHRRLIERSFAEGATQLLRTSAGHRVLGYLYNFRLGNRIYAYQSGFDDSDPRERPGIVSHFLAIRHAFCSGARGYDFMAGRNPLKESFATRREPMFWQVVQQPRLAFRLEHLARRLKRTLVPDGRMGRATPGLP